MKAQEKAAARQMVEQEVAEGVTLTHDKRTRSYRNYLKFKNSLSTNAIQQLKRVKEVREKRRTQRVDHFERLAEVPIKDNKIISFYLDNKRKIKSITPEKITVFESYAEAKPNTQRDKKILEVLQKQAPRLRHLYHLRQEIRTTKDKLRRKEVRKELKKQNAF